MINTNKGKINKSYKEVSEAVHPCGVTSLNHGILTLSPKKKLTYNYQ